jgi:hypothetical protein
MQANRMLTATILAGLLVIAQQPSGPEPEDLIIAFSGNVAGEIEICHCSHGMNGGFPRRGGYLQHLREGSAPVLAVDLGNVFVSASPQGRLKAETCFKAYKAMHYDAIVIAENDLILGVGYLLDTAALNGLDLISATIVRADTREPLVSPYVVRTVECGKRRVRVGILGIASGLSRDAGPPQAYVQNGLALAPAADAAAKYMPRLREEADIIVVAGQIAGDDIAALAQAYPDIAMIVSGRRPTSAAAALTKQNGVRVYYATSVLRQLTVRAGIRLGPSGGAEVRIVEQYLGGDIRPAQPMLDVLKEYTSKLASLPAPAVGNTESAGGRGPAGPRPKFVGAPKCGECHEKKLAIWKGSAHARAVETLAKTDQTKDHDCLPCHTTGYLAPTGFRDVDLTPEMANVQCEACHGRGSRHPDSEGEGYGAIASQMCINCHTPDKDLDWDFDRCWAIIKH